MQIAGVTITPLLAIGLYLVVQLAIGAWVSRRIRTESDYILAGRRLGYGLTTFSIFATWFGAETLMGSAGRAYRDGVSLGSAEPFGYGLCLAVMGLVFAAPLWRRKLTTLADLYRQRYSAGAERLAAVILIPSSVLWAAAQIRAFGYVINTASTGVSVELAIAIAAAFTILYATMGGMLADAITDLVQGVIVIAGVVMLLVWIVPQAGGVAAVADAVADPERVRVLPSGGSVLALLERWAIPVGGSVIATELIGRVLAARSPEVARRSSYMAALLYVSVGAVPLAIGLMGPTLAPALGDPEQLLPWLARELMPMTMYAIFAGALISAILSTVDSTLLVASALLSHNLVVPVFGVEDERAKVRVARAGVMAFGVVAWLLATRAQGVFALVEEASAFGSAGALVTVCFGLFTNWGGPKAAIATLAMGVISYVLLTMAGAETPFLGSLGASLVVYGVIAVFEGGKGKPVPRSLMPDP